MQLSLRRSSLAWPFVFFTCDHVEAADRRLQAISYVLPAYLIPALAISVLYYRLAYGYLEAGAQSCFSIAPFWNPLRARLAPHGGGREVARVPIVQRAS